MLTYRSICSKLECGLKPTSRASAVPLMNVLSAVFSAEAVSQKPAGYAALKLASCG